MAPFIQVANVAISTAGATTVVTNPYKTIAQAQARGFQRGAVIRVHSFNIQNQGTGTVNTSIIDSGPNTLLGPFQIPESTGNWTERATPPGFLFETTRMATSTFAGFDLQISLNSAAACQVFVEYSISFAPGRVAA